MNTQPDYIVCSCGEQNFSHAFRCQACGKIFDGADGHTIPNSRYVTNPGNAHQGQLPPAVRPTNSQSPAVFLSRSKAMAVRAQQRDGRPDVKVAIVTFSEDAELKQEPINPAAVGHFTLHPRTSTNEAAGLTLAGDVWKTLLGSRLNIILLGDGEPTTASGLFRDPAQAAIEVAQSLKSQGARIATIGCRGATMDFNHLRALASSPALAWEAQAGNLTPIFLKASQSMTSHQWGLTGSELVVFVIDESGSMGEDNKQEEVERAVAASIDYLKKV